MIKALGAVAIIALFSVQPAMAAEPEGDAPKKEKRICKREQSVGTLLSGRTCLTRAQWKEREAANRESNRELADAAERDGRGAFVPGNFDGPGGGGSIGPNR